jgi:hypothetical protein
VDADEFIPTADITEAVIGAYPALTGDSVALWAAGQQKTITPNDAAVPVIYATLTTVGAVALLTGSARVSVLVSIVPGV